jgi:ubiquinone/menaquinone biosynthesis C-methylase UbiE
MTQVAVTERRTRSVSLDLDSPELASTYDQVSVRQFNHGKVLISSLAIKAGERVLDVGCGTGRLGDYVAELVGPNGSVIGVDPLPLRVELAGRKHARFSTRVGRAEDLSAFEDSQFDVVYLNSVFHWVEDKATALREAWRVLKPGGRIGVNSADAERSHQGAALVREAVLEEGFSKQHSAEEPAVGTNYRVSAAQLHSLLVDAGFSRVDVTAHTFVDDVAGADDLFAWSSSSSFGNFLSDLNSDERFRVRERLERKLEQLRSRDRSLRLERYLVFANARKA